MTSHNGEMRCTDARDFNWRKGGISRWVKLGNFHGLNNKNQDPQNVYDRKLTTSTGTLFALNWFTSLCLSVSAARMTCDCDAGCHVIRRVEATSSNQVDGLCL